jgi:hypothetical protein
MVRTAEGETGKRQGERGRKRDSGRIAEGQRRESN